MNERRVTLKTFDDSVRHTLRYRHDLAPDDLDKARGFVDDAIKHVEGRFNTRHGMGAQHVDAAVKFLNEKNRDWKNWSPHKRDSVVTAIRGHLGIAEPE